MQSLKAEPSIARADLAFPLMQHNPIGKQHVKNAQSVSEPAAFAAV